MRPRPSIPQILFGVAVLVLLALASLSPLPGWSSEPATRLAPEQWVSIGPDDRELSWPLPPSGELLRVCECGNNAYGERLCHCTQPAATLAETLRQPIFLDVQSRRNLPASAPVPRPRLRYAGQPPATVQP